MSSELKTRVISATLFGIVMVAGIFIPQLFPFLTAAILCITMHEFYRMSMGKAFMVERVLAIIAALLLFGLLCGILLGGLSVKWLVICLIPVLAIMVKPVWYKDHSNHGSLAYVFAGLAYVGIPIALVPLITMRAGVYEWKLLLSLLLIVWLCDIGAYSFGTAFGQKPTSRKLAPAISPKKSWWGFAGAVFSGMLIAVALHYIGWLSIPLVHCVIVGMVSSAAAVLGDLVESMWKRFFGVKDSGNIMPGHGGLYDRFDSAIVAITVAAIYLELFGLL